MRRALILAALWASPAAAVDVPVVDNPFCLSETDATGKLAAYLKSHPDADFDMLEGERAKAWVDAFNALPPTSIYPAEKIWFLHFNGLDFARVTLVSGGAVCMTTQIPEAEIHAIDAHIAEGKL
jgi:hypothetical protein